MFSLRNERQHQIEGGRFWVGFCNVLLSALLPALVALLSACGGRAEIHSPEDPGVDAWAPPEPPRLECKRTHWIALPWEALTLSASPRGSVPADSRFSWRVEEGERSRFLPQGGPVAVLMPSPEESPRVHLEWLGSEGELLGACAYEVEVRSDGPIARCPIEPTRASIDDEVRMVARALDASAKVEGHWSVVQPSPEFTSIIEDGDGAIRASFTTTGLHTFRFEAINEYGERDQCSHSILVYKPLAIHCAADKSVIKRGERTELTATSIDQPIWDGEWSLVGGDDNDVIITKGDRPGHARVQIDEIGRYRFSGVFEDALGERAQCELELEVIADVIELSCPKNLDITPLIAVILRGSVRASIPWESEWRLVESPRGSDADSPTQLSGAQAKFTADLVGHYIAELVVRAEDGSEASCRVNLNAKAQEGLRIELIWSERADLDLHLLSPQANYFFDEKEDCYYATCQSALGQGLEWGEAGAHDNPRLDIDNREYGPENINIDAPSPGRYRLAIHAWTISHRYERDSRHDRVRIYCQGELVYEREGSPLLFHNDLWRIADITIADDGGCTVAPLPVAASPADPIFDIVPR